MQISRRIAIVHLGARGGREPSEHRSAVTRSATACIPEPGHQVAGLPHRQLGRSGRSLHSSCRPTAHLYRAGPLWGPTRFEHHRRPVFRGRSKALAVSLEQSPFLRCFPTGRGTPAALERSPDRSSHVRRAGLARATAEGAVAGSIATSDALRFSRSKPQRGNRRRDARDQVRRPARSGADVAGAATSAAWILVLSGHPKFDVPLPKAHPVA